MERVTERSSTAVVDTIELASLQAISPSEPAVDNPIETAAELCTTKLSIVMPACNEERTIERAVQGLLELDFPCAIELIVINDGSVDDTGILLSKIEDPRMRVFSHPRNFGKGAALLTGFALATGTHAVPFDADLEYSPRDLLGIIEPILAGRAEVVYGSRLFGANTVYQSYRYAMGNKFMTFVANILFDSYISDLHTCLKLVPLPILRELDLTENGFGLDTEITAHLLKRGYRPFEVPISYHSRTHAQGKKLTWRDGVACLAVLVRVRSQSRSRSNQHRIQTSQISVVTPIHELVDFPSRQAEVH